MFDSRQNLNGLVARTVRLAIRAIAHPFPYGAALRAANADLHVLMYHGIKGLPEKAPWDTSMWRDTEQFTTDLEFLAQNFRIVSALDVLHALRVGLEIPPKSLVLTLDDGLREQYEVQVPILLRLGIPATFFINSAFVDNADLDSKKKKHFLLRAISENPAVQRDVETYLRDHSIFHRSIEASLHQLGYGARDHLNHLADLLDLTFSEYLDQFQPYLTTQQIREIVDHGFTIGGHSVDHPNYAELSVERQIDQTLDSVDFLIGRFGVNYRLFAFPYNDRGVSMEFFRRTRDLVDLTFGTRGFLDDPIETNFQRSEIESTGLPTKTAVKYRLLTSYVSSKAQRQGNGRQILSGQVGHG